MATPVVKVVVLGDDEAGVGALMLKYAASDENPPLAFNPYTTHKRFANVGMVEVRLWKISDAQDWTEQLLALNGADAVIAVFSLLKEDTFKGIGEKWSRLVQRHCPPHCRLLLAGGDADARKNLDLLQRMAIDGKALVPKTHAAALKKRIGASAYVEFESSTLSVNRLFAEAVSAALITKLSSQATTKKSVKKSSSGSSRLPGIVADTLHQPLETLRLGTVDDLMEKLSSKSCNAKQVEGSTASPFAEAILAGNLAVADHLLKMSKGIADLSGCNLVKVPSILFKWRGAYMRKIDLSDNCLITLPTELRHFEKVLTTGNPLYSIPTSIRNEKWKVIRSYLGTLVDAPSVQWNVRKVILVGEEGVGKTTLRRALSSKQSKAGTPTNLSTDGVEMTPITFQKAKESQIVFNVWDFGGQVVYYPTHQFFLSSGAIFVLVFSYRDAKLQRLEYWMKYIKSMCDNAVLVMVGTHVDLCTAEEIAAVTATLAERFPKRKYPFLEKAILQASCVTGKGVLAVKDTLMELAGHSAVSPTVPASWVRLHTIVRSKADEETDRVTFKAYAKWAAMVGIEEKEELLLATTVLSNSGSLLYFGHGADGPLDDVVILNPQWLADMMSCVITTRANFVRCGVLKEEDIPRIFLDPVRYPPELHMTFLELLHRFRVIFRMRQDGKTTYFVPSMMSGERPANSLMTAFPSQTPSGYHTVGRMMNFLQLPLGFIERAILSLLHMADASMKVVWRKGVLLTLPDAQLLLEYDSNLYQVYIFFRYPISKPEAAKQWRVALEQVRDIINSFYVSLSRSMEEFALCSHCLRRGVNRERVYTFEYAKCVLAARQGTRVLYCNDIQSASRAVKLHELVPDVALIDLPHIGSSDVTVKEELGEGAVGIVYAAEYKGMKVALKTIKTEGVLSNKEFNEFQAEAFVMTLLDCPNIVKLYGVIKEPLGMVLQYVDGGDLFMRLHPEEKGGERLAQEDFPWATRLAIARDVAVALTHLHEITPPILHRDLRSPNVFLHGDCALVGDFGMARRAAGEVGGVLGSWQWMAPETLDHANPAYDERADLYSMGMVFYELASLQVPFDEYDTEDSRFVRDGNFSTQDVKKAIMQEDLRPTVGDDCPEFFKELMHGLWQGDPALRPSAASVLARLEEAVGNQSAASAIRAQMEAGLTLEVATAQEVVDSLETMVSVSDQTKPSLSLQLDLSESGKRLTRTVAAGSRLWLGTKSGGMLVVERSYSAEGNACLRVAGEWKAHTARIMALLSVGRRVWSCSNDGRLTVWEESRSSFKNVCSWKPFGEDTTVAPTFMALVELDGVKFVWVVAQMEAKISVWNAISFEFVGCITDEQLLSCLFCMQVGDVVWASSGPNILLFHAKTLDFLGQFAAHDSRIWRMVLVGDEVWSAAVNDVAVWSAKSLSEISCVAKSKAHQGKVECMTVLEDEHVLFTSSFDGSVLRWNTKTRKVLEEFAVFDKTFACGVEVADGELWTTTKDGLVNVWPDRLLGDPTISEDNRTRRRSMKPAPKLRKPVPPTSPVIGIARQKSQTDASPSHSSAGRQRQVKTLPPTSELQQARAQADGRQAWGAARMSKRDN